MKSTHDNTFDDLKEILDIIFIKNKENIDTILPKLKFIDACYYVISYLAKVLSLQSQTPEIYEKIFNLLSNIPIDDLKVKFNNKEAKKNKKININNVKQLYRKLWLKFLKSPMPENLRLDAMLILGDEVLDNVDDASTFADVVISSFERSRESGIISLRAIFKLLLLNQMQYDGVYDVLYNLISEDIFQSPYCSKVFDDLDSILSSRSMPHHIATRFLRRIAELTHSGAATHHLPMLVRLVVNLLKKHAGTQILVHNRNHEERSTKSLLEIKDLQNHFDAEIRSIAQEINFKLNDNIDNTRPSKSMESKEKKIGKCRDKIREAIDSLMNNNCSLPELDDIEHFGTSSLVLF